MNSILSPFQQALILSLFPQGARITQARYFQDEYLPAPVRVAVTAPGGEAGEVVLRVTRLNRGGVDTEALLLPILSRLGLPTPQLLAGPATDPDDPSLGPVAVLNLLPGRNLQDISCESPAGLELAGCLLVEAIARLHRLTPQLDREPGLRELPRVSLAAALYGVRDRGGPWLQEPVFVEAVNRLTPMLAAITTPLVFSNGDYQPANFLADGGGLTGFVDFEGACFEDPLVGFAKYRIYDLHPLNKAGATERYLQHNGWTEQEFNPRLALRCLWTLQREIPVEEMDGEYGRHVLDLLRQSLVALP